MREAKLRCFTGNYSKLAPGQLNLLQGPVVDLVELSY